MNPAETVVIAGGYGAVGGRLAAEPAPRNPGGVIIVGRDHGRAVAAAAAIGHGARAARLDVTDRRAVQTMIDTERPRAFIASVARGGAELAEVCLTNGVHFADVTAEAEEITAIERLSATARAHKTTAVLSVGLTPGLTNLLARRACSKLEKVERLDLGVRLGLGDAHGPAALAWTLENFGGPYKVIEDGRERSIRAFEHRRRISFDGGRAGRAGSFNFPEQRTLARTLDIPTVRSWLALDPPAAHLLAVVGARTGLARSLAAPAARLLSPRLLSHLHGHDAWSVWVQATRLRDGRQEQAVLTRSGAHEAAATAHVAAHVATHLLADHEEHGVWHIEQLSDPNAMLDSIDEAVARPARAGRLPI